MCGVCAAQMGKPGEHMAIVLDIDETSPSSHCEVKREDFGYIDGMFNVWLASPEDSVVIPGTLRLFHKAKALVLAVFFIIYSSLDGS